MKGTTFIVWIPQSLGSGLDNTAQRESYLFRRWNIDRDFLAIELFGSVGTDIIVLNIAQDKIPIAGFGVTETCAATLSKPDHIARLQPTRFHNIKHFEL